MDVANDPFFLLMILFILLLDNFIDIPATDRILLYFSTFSLLFADVFIYIMNYLRNLNRPFVDHGFDEIFIVPAAAA